MKIIWLCNIMLPIISENEGEKVSNVGGWMTGLLNNLIKNPEVNLYILFPNNKKYKGKINNISYRSFSKNENNMHYFLNIIKEELPDIIHIFGSEHMHALSMVNACEALGYLDKTVVCIQGIISECAKHFEIGLPRKIVKKKTLRDFIKGDSIYNQIKEYEKRGTYEIQTLIKARNVIGRTKFDYLCTKTINNNVKYYHCDETLRKTFYGNKWKLEKCLRHSIFVSQCNYSYKGFHVMIKALYEIKKRYPDVRLVTTGRKIEYDKVISRVKMTSYEVYLREQIAKYDLGENVIFLGQLNEAQMCEEYLKCNVFVSPSFIENSSNSVGEAMLLGVPIVASFVGGIPSIISDRVEGILYPADDVTLLAANICQLFENDKIAKNYAEAARKRALITHDPQKNIDVTLSIYKELCGEETNDENSTYCAECTL